MFYDALLCAVNILYYVHYKLIPKLILFLLKFQFEMHQHLSLQEISKFLQLTDNKNDYESNWKSKKQPTFWPFIEFNSSELLHYQIERVIQGN